MPEESEVPTEHLHESIEEKLHETADKWISKVALSAAILAVLAAITSMLAGHHSNEAIIEQLKASDQWAYFQSKGIKAGVLSSKIDLFEAMGKPVNTEDTAKMGEFKKEQAEIKDKAEEYQRAGEDHLRRHNTLARGVTAFQIAIALSAIAVLTRRKLLWFTGVLLGLTGVGFLIQAVL